MITLVPLQPVLYREIYSVSCVTDVWFKPTIHQFVEYLSACEGWAITAYDKVIGYCLFTNHKPNHSIDGHISVLPAYQGKWLSRRIYKQMFGFPFDFLKVPKLNTYLVEGYANPSFVERLGFIKEGTVRLGHALPSGDLADMSIWGMLSNERRWK